MPQLGETVTEGTIIRWLKAVGDTVAQDEPLFEVSTDKVDSEVPSPVAGVLTEILVQEGETVDVGARLAVVGEPGSLPSSSGAAPAAAPAPSPPPAAQPAPSAPAPPPPAVSAAPPPPAIVPEPASRVASSPELVTASAQVGGGNGSAGTRGALLSPVVRRLINEHGLDASEIPGTGMGGRITRDDVLRFIESREASSRPAGEAALATYAPVPAAPASPAPAQAPPPAPAMTPAPSGATRPAPASLPASGAPRDEVVPFSTIRRVTAEHMVRSKATSAHTLVAVEADFERIERVRQAHRERFKAEEGISLTYLPFVARAVVDVLRQYPHLNSSVGEDALIVHKDVHLGFAVDLDREGLIVPVLHNADGQSLRGIARSIADLASRARARKLSADDISGGTFSITNPGPFGTYLTVPIIAQPQVAILSTDGVKRRPVVVTAEDGTESIAIHSVGVLALSFDHRAVDGAYAAAFMRDLAHVLETRDWAAEL
jgi:pyruvate dehydrogenase E2 component (dihydrolipoamide acetyltransferase)